MKSLNFPGEQEKENRIISNFEKKGRISEFFFTTLKIGPEK